MRYMYKDGFNVGHWIMQIIGNFIRLGCVLFRILTFNLVYITWDLDWTIFSLKQQDKINDWLKRY